MRRDSKRAASVFFFLPTHPVAEEVRSIKSSSGELIADRGYERVSRGLRPWAALLFPKSASSSGRAAYLHAVACGICQTGDKRTGALAKLGIPADAAERYEARTREDASLVFVSCDGWAQSEWAREILRLLRAEEVCVLGEDDEMECDPPPLAFECRGVTADVRTIGVPGRGGGRSEKPGRRPGS